MKRPVDGASNRGGTAIRMREMSVLEYFSGRNEGVWNIARAAEYYVNIRS